MKMINGILLTTGMLLQTVNTKRPRKPGRAAGNCDITTAQVKIQMFQRAVAGYC